MSKDTLADKIQSVLNAAPRGIDPEEDDLTFEQVELSEKERNEDPEVHAVPSKLRKLNASLLADVDQRYIGKKATRKTLKGSDEEDFSEEDGDETDDDEEGDEEEEGEDEDNSLEDESESDFDEDDSINDEKEHSTYDENESNFKNFTSKNDSNQVTKGICVRNQLKTWEDLINLRMQLQKCLAVANQMPQTDTFNEIKKQAGSEFTKKVAETKKNVTGILDRLLLLQQLVQKKYPETRKLDKQSIKKEEDDDEEIPSDTEDEISMKDESDNETDEPLRKKRKISEYETDISKQFKRYKEYRNSVIQKWNEKTSIGAMKSNLTSNSVLNQIDFILSDKQRLIKRTQCKRSNYDILGERKENDTNSEIEKENSTEEYNKNIYDDDDFYLQLVTELISMKSAGESNSIQLSTKWIKLLSIRKKMKRNIDTRATKGRKLRYDVHSKLGNMTTGTETRGVSIEIVDNTCKQLLQS